MSRNGTGKDFVEPLDPTDGVEVYLHLADAPEPTEEDIAASMAAAGGWADIDADKLIRELYERRLV